MDWLILISEDSGHPQPQNMIFGDGIFVDITRRSHDPVILELSQTYRKIELWKTPWKQRCEKLEVTVTISPETLRAPGIGRDARADFQRTFKDSMARRHCGLRHLASNHSNLARIAIDTSISQTHPCVVRYHSSTRKLPLVLESSLWSHRFCWLLLSWNSLFGIMTQQYKYLNQPAFFKAHTANGTPFILFHVAL